MGTKTGLITDSIDRSGKLIKLKGYKDKIDADRKKLMAKYLELQNGKNYGFAPLNRNITADNVLGGKKYN
jgi:hypothetical protein